MPVEFPERRHPGCEDPRCAVCMEDHKNLGHWFDEQIGTDTIDFLGSFHSFLGGRDIIAQTDHGWGSSNYFERDLADAFVKEWLEEDGLPIADDIAITRRFGSNNMADKMEESSALEAENERLRAESYWGLIEEAQDMWPPGCTLGRSEVLAWLESRACHKPQQMLRAEHGRYQKALEEIAARQPLCEHNFDWPRVHAAQALDLNPTEKGGNQ